MLWRLQLVLCCIGLLVGAYIVAVIINFIEKIILNIRRFSK